MFVMLSRDSHLYYLCLHKILEQMGNIWRNWVWSIWKKSEKNWACLHYSKIIPLTSWRKLLLLPVSFHSYFSPFLLLCLNLYFGEGKSGEQIKPVPSFFYIFIFFSEEKKKKEKKKEKRREERRGKEKKRKREKKKGKEQTINETIHGKLYNTWTGFLQYLLIDWHGSRYKRGYHNWECCASSFCETRMPKSKLP